MALRKLALYHADSLIYKEQVNGTLESVKNNLFCEDTFSNIFNAVLGGAIAEIQSWGADYEKYLPDLTFVKDNFNAITEDTLQPGKGMGVFIHGEMWLNNILVQDQNGSAPPSYILLIDFQFCGWASRAIDLIYFAFTTLNEEDCQEHFEDVLRFYNDEFTSALQKFNYKDIPEYSQFREEVQKKLPYGENNN